VLDTYLNPTGEAYQFNHLYQKMKLKIRFVCIDTTWHVMTLTDLLSDNDHYLHGACETQLTTAFYMPKMLQACMLIVTKTLQLCWNTAICLCSSWLLKYDIQLYITLSVMSHITCCDIFVLMLIWYIFIIIISNLSFISHFLINSSHLYMTYPWFG
jgi:hypothetical protein